MARVNATAAARSAIARLRAAGVHPMFVQSAGCCAGSVPMCFHDGEYLVGAGDRLLGRIEGCPFYIDAHLDDALGRPDLVLDIEEGRPEGFSLAAGDGRYFVTRRPAQMNGCARTIDRDT